MIYDRYGVPRNDKLLCGHYDYEVVERKGMSPVYSFPWISLKFRAEPTALNLVPFKNY